MRCSCKVCNFEVYDRGKCILHCKKNYKNNWYNIDESGAKKWNSEKLKLFWEKINLNIAKLNEQIDNPNQRESAEEIQNEYNYEIFKYNFNNVVFPKSIFDDIVYKSFMGLDKRVNIYFNNCIFLSQTDFNVISNAKNISFEKCIFLEDIEIKNQKFQNNFIFEHNRLYSNSSFQNITFLGITSFIKTKVYEKLTFIHTKSENLFLCNSANINTLILENTFFKDEANFLNIKIKDTNRETARIIKHSFEKQNNIIEANKFYALEMKENEKELKFFKQPLDWIVFKVHGCSSKHSQNWLLPLSWIFFLSFIVYDGLDLIQTSIIDSFFSIYYSNILTKIANGINPFSIMTGKETLSFGILIYKSIIAYLIYQFIISIRQNTRRN